MERNPQGLDSAIRCMILEPYVSRESYYFQLTTMGYQPNVDGLSPVRKKDERGIFESLQIVKFYIQFRSSQETNFYNFLSLIKSQETVNEE